MFHWAKITCGFNSSKRIHVKRIHVIVLSKRIDEVVVSVCRQNYKIFTTKLMVLSICSGILRLEFGNFKAGKSSRFARHKCARIWAISKRKFQGEHALRSKYSAAGPEAFTKSPNFQRNFPVIFLGASPHSWAQSQLESIFLQLFAS